MPGHVRSIPNTTPSLLSERHKNGPVSYTSDPPLHHSTDWNTSLIINTPKFLKARTHTHRETHTNTHTHTHTHSHTRLHTHTHTHSLTHSHIHAHTHLHTPPPRFQRRAVCRCCCRRSWRVSLQGHARGAPFTSFTSLRCRAR